MNIYAMIFCFNFGKLTPRDILTVPIDL